MTQRLAHAPRADRRRPAAAHPQRAPAAGRDRARVRPLQRRRHAARPVDLPHARDDRAHDREAQRRRRRRLLVPDGSSGCRSSGTATRSCGSRPRSRAARSSPPTRAPSAAPAARRTSRRSGASHALRPGVRQLLGARRSSRSSTARRRPPVGDGFRRFVGHEGDRGGGGGVPRARAARRARRTPTTRTRRCPSGSPPSRACRPASRTTRPARSSCSPIPPPPSSACSTFLIGLDARSFKPVAWDEVGTEVYVQAREAMTRSTSRRCSTASRSASLPDAVERIPATTANDAARARRRARVADGRRRRRARRRRPARAARRRLDGRGAARPAGLRAPRRRR